MAPGRGIAITNRCSDPSFLSMIEPVFYLFRAPTNFVKILIVNAELVKPSRFIRYAESNSNSVANMPNAKNSIAGIQKAKQCKKFISIKSEPKKQCRLLITRLQNEVD
jgi:hypothetical protein